MFEWDCPFGLAGQFLPCIFQVLFFSLCILCFGLFATWVSYLNCFRGGVIFFQYYIQKEIQTKRAWNKAFDLFWVGNNLYIVIHMNLHQLKKIEVVVLKYKFSVQTFLLKTYMSLRKYHWIFAFVSSYNFHLRLGNSPD